MIARFVVFEDADLDVAVAAALASKVVDRITESILFDMRVGW